MSLRCADSRFAKPRSFPERERFYSFCIVQKEPKSTPEVCEPLDSGDDSKLCRKWFCKAFRRLVPKAVLPAKRRRKGFESVRKGYRSADARLRFFEKGLLHCKLTVGCRRWNVWLLVSFGVVRSRCRCALKKAFLCRLALHEPKKRLYRETKKFHYQKALRTSLKATFLRTKISFARTFLRCPQKISIFTNQKLFFCTNLFYCHPKQLFSTLRRPFVPPLTYCPQRIQLFFCCSL